MVIRLLLLTVVAIYLAACTNQPSGQTDKEAIIEQTSNQENEVTANNNEIANHLANIANEVPDVDNAVAILAGPYAVVGIDVDEQIDRQRVGTIKFSVNEALRDDPYGKTAIVIADADAMERIGNMRERMRNGEPIQGLVDELADIVGRLMPTFPVEERKSDEIEQEDGTILEDGRNNNKLNERDERQNHDDMINDRTNEDKSNTRNE